MTLGLDRDRLVTLDKLSSVGLLILGMMALAEACGIAVQSILTVGGIGGIFMLLLLAVSRKMIRLSCSIFKLTVFLKPPLYNELTVCHFSLKCTWGIDY